MAEDKVVAEEAQTKSEKDTTTKKVAPKKTSSEKVEKMIGVDRSGVILRPLISEKSARLAGSNQYVFVVRKNANRVEILSAIKQMYGIMPTSVNIMNMPGKEVRFGQRKGLRSDWKKAIITLPAGKNINVYEGV